MTAVATLLWPVVGRPIVEANFSYSRRLQRYQPFDDADRQFIAEALAFDDENQL
jgi:hypothetical protein